MVNITINYNPLFTTIEEGAFIGASTLKTLILDQNSLETIQDNTFNGLEKLETLILDFNNIDHLPIDSMQSLKRLKVLSVSNSSIRSLDSNMFANNTDILMLNFNANQINSISSDFLDNLPSMNALYLQHNKCIDGAWEINGEIERERVFRALTVCFQNAVESPTFPPSETTASPTGAPESPESPSETPTKKYVLELRGSLTLQSENGTVIEL